MSSAIDQLRRAFVDNCIPTSQTTLEEPAARMSRTLFRGKIEHADLLICRLDPNCINLFPYFRKSESGGLKGMRCICDYVIFVENEDILYVLLFELKKGGESPKKQLDLSEPFFDFVLKRASIMRHINIQYKIRKIGISDEPEKRTTADRGILRYENNYLKLYRNKKIYLQTLLH